MHIKSSYFPAIAACFLILISNYSCSDTSDKKSVKVDTSQLYITHLDQSKLIEATPLYDHEAEKIKATISVDSSISYQEIDGFGFTLNGGSAKHLQNMSAAERASILHELFSTDSTGIGVSYLRLSVGASDLDERTWSYNDLDDGEKDLELSKFTMAYDTLYLLPTLKEILSVAPHIKIMASPWSPPKWMKDNKDTRGGSLKPEYYAVYAEYLIKYILEMKNEGLYIDVLTIQNEPLNPENNPSLLMLADQQSAFIKNYLGPAFIKNNISTKIVLYDHNADRPDYPISILDDSETAKYVDGSAFHLYAGSIDALSEVHDAHPSKNIYFSEQWIGAPGNFAGDFSWHIENIIIGATRNWSKTVLEWNLAADENQKPHTDRGGCNKCLGALTITEDKVVRNTAYYVIAQVSKFIPPGSYRIDSNVVENFPNVAFKKSNGQVVVIVQNKHQSAQVIQIKSGTKAVNFSMEAGSVATLVL